MTSKDESDRGDDGTVVPFRHWGNEADEASWCFTTKVHYVTGPDGDWLGRELSGVMRDLLLWAREERLRQAGGQDEERTAA